MAFAKLVTGSSATVEGPGAVAPTPGFHPAIEPASVSKRNTARPLFPALSLTTKSLGFESLLNTCPVGAPDGMLTVRATLFTVVGDVPLYSVVTSAPLSETHKGEP